MNANGNCLILIIDDEPTVLDISKKMLEFSGFSVLTACCGREGVDLFRQNAPDVDLVILDMTMPDMDGVATFAELQSVAPEVRVVVSSGYQQSEAMDQFPSNGPVCFVQKPFRMQTLIQTVKDCVNASA